MNEDKLKLLSETVEKLAAQVAGLEKIDANALFASSKKRSSAPNESRPTKPKANEKPDWVKTWNRRNASHGQVKTVVKTTETFHEDTGIVDSKTELINPIVTVEHKRNLATGEVEEVVREAALPDHLRLDRLHDDRPQPIAWDQRPTHDAVPPRGLTMRETEEWLKQNPGNPLVLRDEGPAKPVRKQMTRLNKVWKYRNFKKCGSCEEYDTWEARVDPYNLENVGVVHAEIWCHKCGAIDFEVADSMPAHIGSWAPPRETSKQARDRATRQAYRRQRAIYSLVESPKTAQELANWFREVEKYEAVDPIMLELMLRRMRSEGLVVQTVDGKWWDREDYLFEHPAAHERSK